MRSGCFVSVGRSLDEALERVRLAESLGYEAVFTTHIAGWESTIVLAAYGAATERIRLGTGVVPIYTRTPATMAQTAASLDALSGGRFTLGLGVSHRLVVEEWHGQTIDRPAAEMREYLTAVRAILRGEEVPPGEKWSTSFHLVGLGRRSELPLYMAALSPAMLRLAGEIADGVILWLCNPHYIRDVVIPEVTKGRDRAGRSLSGFELVAAIPSAVTDDVDAAHAAIRSELLTYFGLPFYRAMIERSGFGEDIAAYDAAGGDPAKMRAAISDEFLSVLTAIGTREDVRASLQRYVEAGLTLPCAGPVGRTDFAATLEATAP